MKSIQTWLCGLTAASALAFLAGCGGGTPTKPAAAPPSKDKHDDDEDHEHGAGPHGGTVFDLGGGKYHAEFTVDHGKQEARVYLLAANAKTAVPVKAETMALDVKEPKFRVELKADPQPGDPKGSASAFAGKDERLGKVQEFAGTVSVVIDGTPFTGTFKEEPHKEDAHKK
jgi:hypothetical protein